MSVKNIRKTVFAFTCLFSVFNSSLFGQAVRSIPLSGSLPRVDDDGSVSTGLGFTINFFGVNYSNVWVNNNGNITFNSALDTYTPYLIAHNSIPMFAPFFADVDSRFYGNVTKYGTGTLEIAPGNSRPIFCVNWIDVGFFNGSGAPSDRTILNSFQMIITNRDDIAPGDFDLEYNYDKVKWEAGTASEGSSSGLGGTKTASMGWSNGTTTYYSHSGSLQAGAFLDTGPKSLKDNSLNSTVKGRYVFFVRNGVVVDLIGPQTFTISELAGPSALVGRVNTTTLFPRDSISFSIVPPVLPEFAMAADTSGAIRVGADARFDFANKSTYTFLVVANYRNGVYRDTALMTVNLTPNILPTTNPVTISNPLTPSPTIGWTYTDAENRPQTRYDVEVRTGPNGTGSSFWHPDTGNGAASNLLYAGPALLNGQTYYARVRAFDGTGWGSWSEAAWTTALNAPPVAKAGRDSTLYAGASCQAALRLDGSGSSDPDGDSITYAWSGAFSGTLTGISPTVSLPLGAQNILLAVTDSKAAIGRDTVAITVLDSLKPIPSLARLPDVLGSCSASLKSIAPTATDNCKATITATTVDSISFATQGTRTVHWIYTDDNGNISTQNQTVIVRDLVPPKITPGSDTSIIISASMLSSRVALKPASAIDSCSLATSLGTRDDGLSLDSAYRLGITKVQWKACDNFGNCDSSIQKVTLIRNRPPVLVANLDTAYKEKDFLRFLITATDSDGTLARISAATELPSGGSFIDSGSGKASLLWPRNCNDHCVDRVTLQASDGIDSVSSQIIVQQVDKPAAFHPNATAFADSTLFPDSICMQFTTPTDSATLHYVLSGPGRDTSSFLIGDRQNLCFDRTVTVTVAATRPGWINSLPLSLHVLKMDTAQAPEAKPGDSTYFQKSLCVTLTSATPGSKINLTLRGRSEDSMGIVKPNGDSVCIEDTTTILAITRKAGMVQSPERSFNFIRMQKAATPVADKPDSTWFADSLCLRIVTATPDAEVHYSLNGSAPDSSALILVAGTSLCLDGSAKIRAIALKPHWINSDEILLHMIKMDTVGIPVSDRKDSTYFRDSLCFNLSVPTAGAEIHYTRDGGAPDTSRALFNGSGRMCVYDTAKVRAIGKKTNWITGQPAAWTYIRMQKVAGPIADKPDSSWFVDTLCVRFTLPTPGSEIHYTLDGGRADTSTLVLPAGEALCRDRSGDIHVAALKTNWIPSNEILLTVKKMDTVSVPVADKSDSIYYQDSVCVNLSTATPGADIRLTTDGGTPDTTANKLSEHGRVCMDKTENLRAVATREHWINSQAISRTFIRMQRIAQPRFDQSDSTYFKDSLCVHVTSATDSVKIQYSTDGGRADTSSRFMSNGALLCLDASAKINAIAVQQNWIPSEAGALTIFRMETVAPPLTDIPDSTFFKDSLCVHWTIPTPNSEIHYTHDAGKPDTTSTFMLGGTTTCFDRSVSIRSVGMKTHWINSAEVNREYIRMQPIPKPGFDRGDTVFYPSVCVQLSSAVAGADLHYTLDGGNPDTSSQIKHGGDTLCLDRTGDIKVMAKKKNWLDSDPASIHLVKMAQVAEIHSSVGTDSIVYAHKLCFRLFSATDSTRIKYSLDGGDPLTSGLSIASGDSVCLEQSAVVVAVGTRDLWRNSLPSRFVFVVDNAGPDILKAVKHPFNIQNLSVTGNCRGIGQDTLVLTLSEKLKPKSNPPRWDRLAVFSSRCDFNAAMPVTIQGDPIISSDSLTLSLLLDNNSSAEAPKLSNCIYLDSKSGEFTDQVLNLPEKNGIKITGSEKLVRISQLRAYPPIVGLDNTSTSQGCIDEGVSDNTWIPPVGFDPVKGIVDPNASNTCTSGSDNGTDTPRSSIPACTSILEVISDGAYVADVRIFDQLGNFVSGSRQRFGACGELDNLNRSVAGKKRSFLVWNTRDNQGARVGTGAYVWRVNFISDRNDGKQSETVFIRTGFLRGAACND